MDIYLKNRLKKNLVRLIPLVVFLVILAIAAFFINKNTQFDDSVISASSAEKAVVTEIVSGDVTLNENGIYTGSQVIKARVLTGKFKGEIIQANNTSDQYEGVICKVGSRVMLAISESEGSHYAFVTGYDHTIAYICMFGLFTVAMIAIAGIKGIKSLAGLLITFITLIWVFIPLLCHGLSPYLVSIIWAIITTVISITLISGYNKKTLSTIISTIAGVTISGLFAIVFGAAAHVSGFNMDYAEEIVLLETNQTIKVKGLLFAAILIASLGAVMDVCMSIASTVNEIYETNPKISKKELFKSGMNVGKDTIGTMANTLILAFAGSSLTMIILLYSYKANMNYFVSMNDVAIEIIQGVAGSLGICLCVPVVALVSTNLAFIKKKEKPLKGNKKA